MSLIYFVRLIDWGCTSLCIWESFEDFQKHKNKIELYTLVEFKSWLECHGNDCIDIQYIGVSTDLIDTMDIIIK